MVGKSLAAFAIVLRASAIRLRTALTISASLAQIGEFSFILAGLGVTLGAAAAGRPRPDPRRRADLDHAQSAAVRGAATAGRRAATRAPLRDAPTASPPWCRWTSPATRSWSATAASAAQLATLLHERGVPLVVIEDDADLVAQARADGFPAIRGNAANPTGAWTKPRRSARRMAVFAIPQALEAGETSPGCRPSIRRSRCWRARTARRGQAPARARRRRRGAGRTRTGLLAGRDGDGDAAVPIDTHTARIRGLSLHHPDHGRSVA